MTTKPIIATVLPAAAVLAALVVGTGGPATARRHDPRPGSPTYTVLDHPARACHLSVRDVANWGETSAHLPQACTYGR